MHPPANTPKIISDMTNSYKIKISNAFPVMTDSFQDLFVQCANEGTHLPYLFTVCKVITTVLES